MDGLTGSYRARLIVANVEWSIEKWICDWEYETCLCNHEMNSKAARKFISEVQCGYRGVIRDGGESDRGWLRRVSKTARWSQLEEDSANQGAALWWDGTGLCRLPVRFKLHWRFGRARVLTNELLQLCWGGEFRSRLGTWLKGDVYKSYGV